MGVCSTKDDDVYGEDDAVFGSSNSLAEPMGNEDYDAYLEDGVVEMTPRRRAKEVTPSQCQMFAVVSAYCCFAIYFPTVAA